MDRCVSAMARDHRGAGIWYLKAASPSEQEGLRRPRFKPAGRSAQGRPQIANAAPTERAVLLAHRRRAAVAHGRLMQCEIRSRACRPWEVINRGLRHSDSIRPPRVQSLSNRVRSARLGAPKTSPRPTRRGSDPTPETVLRRPPRRPKGWQPRTPPGAIPPGMLGSVVHQASCERAARSVNVFLRARISAARGRPSDRRVRTMVPTLDRCQLSRCQLSWLYAAAFPANAPTTIAKSGLARARLIPAVGFAPRRVPMKLGFLAHDAATAIAATKPRTARPTRCG
jgi:hypothetical protein